MYKLSFRFVARARANEEFKIQTPGRQTMLDSKLEDE